MAFSRFELWERLVSAETTHHQEYAIKAVDSIEGIEYAQLVEWLKSPFGDIDEDTLAGEFLVELKDSMVEFMHDIMPKTTSSQNMGCIGYFLEFEQEIHSYYYFCLSMKSPAEMEDIYQGLGVQPEFSTGTKDSLYKIANSFFHKFLNTYCDGYLDEMHSASKARSRVIPLAA